MIDKPNVVLPLAYSYNERGVQGYTHAVTNGEDQRKVNCFYEPVKNNMTGKGTLTLSKRPGASICTATLGFSTQVPYAVCRNLNVGIDFPPVLFAVTNTGTHIIASHKTGANGSVTTVASLGGGTAYIPRFAQVVQRYSAGVGEENFLVQAVQPEFGQRVFYTTNANGAWNEITDVDFPTIIAGKIEQIDGYLFAFDASGFIRNSDLNSLDAWTATNYKAKEIALDRAVGLAKQGNQLLAFGDTSVEVFYNAGGTTGSPLGRLSHIANNIGMVNTYRTGQNIGSGMDYYCTIGKRIYFVGRETGALNSVGLYSYEGGQFTRASTTYTDKILSDSRDTIFSVNAISVLGQEAVSICFTVPGDATQRWLMFFPEWKEWFEWNSTIFSSVGNGQWFVGTSDKNRVYSITDSDLWQDNGTSYQWLTQFRLPSNGGSRNRMTMYGLDADTDTSANSITVDVSDDDCQSFYTLGSLDLTRDRKMGFRGGSFRKRHVRLSATDARPKRVYQFLARVDG